MANIQKIEYKGYKSFKSQEKEFLLIEDAFKNSFCLLCL